MTTVTQLLLIIYTFRINYINMSSELIGRTNANEPIRDLY